MSKVERLLRLILETDVDTDSDNKKSPEVQSSAWSQKDRSDDSSAKKGSTECRTQKIGVFGCICCKAVNWITVVTTGKVQ
jgi:hypothetical protein